MDFRERKLKMKKILSAILACVFILGTMLVLVSCGGGIDDGKYVGSNGNKIEISGTSLVITVTEFGETFDATYKYEVKNNEQDPEKQVILLTLESNNYEGQNEKIKADYTPDGKTMELYYERFEDGFVIGGIKYTKK